MVKLVAGKYEPGHNILHLWFPAPVELTTPDRVEAFFREVVEEWIDSCPRPPFLLVDYDNLHISTAVTAEYARRIGEFQSKVLATFRYGLPPDLTGVAVSLGNVKLARPVNIFDDEAAARAAIAAWRR
jgi:hypothetical protein